MTLTVPLEAVAKFIMEHSTAPDVALGLCVPGYLLNDVMESYPFIIV